ncbi:MAG: hypothetical protein ACRDRW_08550 [Pseudonocardiaceae bacterium]
MASPEDKATINQAPEVLERQYCVDLPVEQGAGHDEALDLVGALVYLGDLSPGQC